MAADSPQKPPRKPTARSRVTNGSKLGDMDGRGKWARRFSDLIQEYSQEVASNADDIPATVASLIRRAATLTVELERAEATFAKAGKAAPTALSEYQTTVNSLRRILQDLQVKAQAPEHLTRPMVGRMVDISTRQVMRNVRANMTVDDWKLAHGPTDTVENRRDVARHIAFVINEAIINNEPLPEALAIIAVECGLGQMDAEQGGTVIDLDSHRIQH